VALCQDGRARAVPCRMNEIDPHDLAYIVRRLGNGEVHVFSLPYERAHKRRPLREVLGAYIGVPGDEVTLIDGEFGRPTLDIRHGAALDFNWSHSGDRALIAIGRHLVPGIDIERLRGRPKALEIAEHYFCKEEFSQLSSLPEEKRNSAFLELWTAKEAVLKAMGRGIAFGLDRLHVTNIEKQPVLRWLDDDDAKAWQLQRLDVGENYIATIAWRGPARTVVCWSLTG
jgi:4'-phosphopantetheinyl transferase